MNRNNIFNGKKTTMILFVVFFIFSQVFISCKKDNPEVDPYFTIEGDPTGLSVDKNTNTQSYIVRSNSPWQIIAQEECDWARAFPTEGDDDGIFKFIIEESNEFVDRVVNFAFIVNGEEQPILFRIEQEANTAYITILDAENGISIASAGGSISINIKANVNWTYTLDDASWLSEQEVTEDEIILLAERNRGDVRTVKLTVSSAEFPGLDQEVLLTQSSGAAILEEDFSWLTYGSDIPYVTTGETRYEFWTPEEQARGWYVTPNEFSSDQPCTYARNGFVKLGKTNYGGDLISSNLDIEGTVNLKVTFKAAAYISASGNIDDRILKIYSLGAGTASVSEFTIDNIPNSEAEDAALVVNDIWDPARAYSFTITGATSSTRIKFLGGDYGLSGVGQGKNRIFLDDIKVEIIE